MNRFSIKDIENLTGIKAHTLRIWEQRHGIIKPKRTDTNIRYYDAYDLKQALRVSLLNKYGYKISRIRKMDDTEISDAISEQTSNEFKLEYQVNILLTATIDMDAATFEHHINEYIKNYGVEQTVEELIFKFLEKIGIMWMTNRVLPAQEHISSHIIEKKLLLATEQLKTEFTSNKQVLLYLPEGEIHEIALLYVNYLLRKKGIQTIYLGPNSPIDQVEFVVNTLEPEYIYTHLTSVSRDFDLSEYLKVLDTAFKNKQVYVSGSMINEDIISLYENIHLLTSLNSTKKFIEDIR